MYEHKNSGGGIRKFSHGIRGKYALSDWMNEWERKRHNCNCSFIQIIQQQRIVFVSSTKSRSLFGGFRESACTILRKHTTLYP